MENWKTQNWRQMDLPKKPAVYAIYVNGYLFYIGQTSNLRNRFVEHNIRLGYGKNIHLPWLSVSSDVEITIKYSLSRKYGDWAMRELRLINKLKPPANRRGIKKKREVDMLRMVSCADKSAA